MSFSFVFVCFFFRPFESRAKLVSVGYANSEEEWLVWLPEKLSSFSVASILKRGRRFRLRYEVLFGQTRAKEDKKNSLLSVDYNWVP